MSETMRAVVWERPGARLTVERVPIPVPKRGEALVKVAACGVCHTDLHVMKGEVAFPSPAVLGHEISGTLEAFGPDTGRDDLAVGDRVVGAFIMPCGECRQCDRGRDDLCVNFFAQNRLRGTLYDGTSRLARQDGSVLAMYSMGGLAEYAVVPITALATLSEGLPLVQSAILGCAAFTAYGAVHHATEVAAGDVVAVVAVGGIGSSLLQVARAAGATTVIAVDVDDAKLESARALGADHVINSRTVDAPGRVRELTEGRGADVVFEALGLPQTFEQAVAMLAEGGRMAAIGIAAGSAKASIEITPMVRRGQRITGSFGGRTRQDLPRVVEMAASGGFDVEGTVTRRFPLEQVNEAFEALAAGTVQRRAVIEMAG